MNFAHLAFETPLDIRREIEAVKRDGARVEAVLLADYAVTFDWNGLRRRLTVPARFMVAPSVPPAFHDTVPFWGALFEASVIHDWCYWTRCFDPLTDDGKLAADELFLCALEAGDVTWWDRQLVFTAVRAFGADMYAANTFQPDRGPVLIQGAQP